VLFRSKVSVEGKIRFSVHAPLLSLTKSEIIEKGRALGLDYSLTWSCYDPQPASSENLKAGNAEGGRYLPCGRCDSCLFRGKGFKDAGMKDPAVCAAGQRR
jgi:7-cyano-7-deazaguanine synthase